jgi:Na+-driven multidrug efflux pump
MSTFFLVEPQMMAMFALQGMGFGGRAVLITLSRNVLLVVPGLVLLPLFFGATGAFAAQPAADVLSLFITAALMVPVYRKYPPSATAETVPPAEPVRQT